MKHTVPPPENFIYADYVYKRPVAKNEHETEKVITLTINTSDESNINQHVEIILHANEYTAANQDRSLTYMFTLNDPFWYESRFGKYALQIARQGIIDYLLTGIQK